MLNYIVCAYLIGFCEVQPISVIMLIVLIAILIYVIGRQFHYYKATIKLVDDFVGMFSYTSSDYSLIHDEEDDRVVGIQTQNKNLSTNKYFNVVSTSINKYLRNNSGAATDFNIIKDIVERNTEAIASEINTQVPFPLYFGLVGTMAGIIIGVFDLVLSGSLIDLLNGSGVDGANGIQILLLGVAIAMIASICGVTFTTKGSNVSKNACAEVETRKNDFLTWAQAELLPELNTNFSEELMRMTDKLTNFNRTFSDNSRFLQSALKEVREATVGQSEMLKAVKDLNVVDMAEACAKTVAGLHKSISSIEQLSLCLASSADYLREVRILNEKLDNSESRVHAMEEVAIYFKDERTHLDTIKSVMATKVGEIDTIINDCISNLGKHTQHQIQEMINLSGAEYDKLVKTMSEQSNAVAGRIKELGNIADELKQMTKVKVAMDDLNSSMQEQNRKIDKLIYSIQELAKVKSGASPSGMMIPGIWKNTGIVLVFLIGCSNIMFILYFILKIGGVL